MQLVTVYSKATVLFERSASTLPFEFRPGETHLMSDGQRNTIVHNGLHIEAGMKFAQLEGRLPPFTVGDKRRGSLFLYPGAAGYGDQLMALPVAKILQRDGFDLTVGVETGNEQVWRGTGIKTRVLPCYEKDLGKFDQTALFEFVTNFDSLPGQLHPVDALLLRLGYDHKAVPAELKVVPPVLSNAELVWAEKTFKEPYGMVQLSASNKPRSMSDANVVELLTELRKATGMKIIAALDCFVRQHRPGLETAAKSVSGVQTYAAPSLRHYMAVAAKAAFAAGPDSFLCHVRGSLGLSYAAVFGLTDPALRTCYYPKVKVVWRRQACRFAPCQHIFPGYPSYCPTGKLDACAVMDDAGVVSDTVKIILSQLQGS